MNNITFLCYSVTSQFCLFSLARTQLSTQNLFRIPKQLFCFRLNKICAHLIFVWKFTQIAWNICFLFFVYLNGIRNFKISFVYLDEAHVLRQTIAKRMRMQLSHTNAHTALLSPDCRYSVFAFHVLIRLLLTAFCLCSAHASRWAASFCSVSNNSPLHKP